MFCRKESNIDLVINKMMAVCKTEPWQQTGVIKLTTDLWCWCCWWSGVWCWWECDSFTVSVLDSVMSSVTCWQATGYNTVQSSLSSTTSRAVLCPLKLSHSVQYPRPPPAQPSRPQWAEGRTLSSQQTVVLLFVISTLNTQHYTHSHYCIVHQHHHTDMI